VLKNSRILALAMTLTALQLPGVWAATPTSADNPDTLQEVTVTAHRIELEKRVARFVNQIAATENGAEGLARWQVPSVCPLVSGVPQQDGEFMLARLSEIARLAGVPLGDEHCGPNLYILVTDQAEELLRGMERRNRPFTFGYDTSFYPPVETSAALVDEFIKTPRPVRVWYNSAQKDAWGKPLGYCRLTDLIPLNDPSLSVQCGPGTAGGSHIVFSSIWTFSRVFVIVDRTRVHGVTLGQLADYVAMSGFAKLKPDAHLGDAPTILTLFNGASTAAPAGMTDWDSAFLKSLYATDQEAKLQRSQITHHMVHEMGH
jgi:hypothetical protein